MPSRTDHAGGGQRSPIRGAHAADDGGRSPSTGPRPRRMRSDYAEMMSAPSWASSRIRSESRTPRDSRSHEWRPDRYPLDGSTMSRVLKLSAGRLRPASTDSSSSWVKESTSTSNRRKLCGHSRAPCARPRGPIRPAPRDVLIRIPDDRSRVVVATTGPHRVLLQGPASSRRLARVGDRDLGPLAAATCSGQGRDPRRCCMKFSAARLARHSGLRRPATVVDSWVPPSPISSVRTRVRARVRSRTG